jgi:hypothetical protein
MRIDPNRPWNPALDAAQYKTYRIAAPLSTHWRRATCEEVACPQGELGWKMRIDLSTELGQKQAHYIKHQSGRNFTWEKEGDAGMVVLTFPSGQDCFQEHKVRLDREERYIVRGGDHRGNPTGAAPRVHTKPEHWVEDFQENQAAIAEVQRKG